MLTLLHYYYCYCCVQAVELGWIPKDWRNPVLWEEVAHVCDALLGTDSPDPAATFVRIQALVSSAGGPTELWSNNFAAVVTVGIWLAVVALLLGAAACAVRLVGLVCPLWLQTEYVAIPDKDDIDL